MIPNASGSTPPPMPWIARAVIMIGRFVASAASRQPIDNAISDKTKTFFLPTASPMRPMIGVKIDADSR
jgi:hypothetical protein